MKLLEKIKASYLIYYYKIVGNKLVLYFFLCLFVGILDGLGLAMFVPLIQKYSGSGSSITTGEEGGFIDNILSYISDLGVTINFKNIIGIIIIIFLLKGGLKFLQLRYHVYLRTLFIQKIRNSIVEKVSYLKYESFHDLNIGRLQNVSTVEVNKLYQSFQYYFLTVQNLILLITYSSLAFIANYRFSLAVAVSALFINFVFRFLYNKSKRISSQISVNNNNYNTLFIELIQNFKYLKTTGYSNVYRKKIKTLISNESKLQSKIGFYSSIVTGLKEPIIVVLVLSIVTFEVVVLKTNIDAILVSILLFYRALTSLGVLQNYWQSFVANVGSFENLNEMTDYLGRNAETRPSGIKMERFEVIKLLNVDVQILNKHILRGINLSIDRGKIYSFTGPSGSGKTTIVNLITGLIKPSSGQVMIDTSPLNTIDIDFWRNKVGVVTQEVVIFNDSLYNNITFWDEKTEKNIEKFNKAIGLSSLTNFFDSTGHNLDFSLGLNGSSLSGGQRQRIAIARELYKESNILIFDEATSALDMENEEIIHSTIEKLKGNVTILIVTHKLSSLKQADVVVLVEDGVISYEGSLTDLYNSESNFVRKINAIE